MAEELEPKKVVDWELIERHYRAGIKTLRQIGEEYGTSHVSIQKRAKKFGWTRSLTEKIQQKAQELVTKQAVTKAGTNQQLLTDSQTVQAYSEIVANVEMTQRSDLDMALNLSRSQMVELTALSRPDIQIALEQLGEMMDTSGKTDDGRVIVDKANELYRYIISLPGRVKMAKEIAAAHGVYIPIQRKVFKLDGDEKSNKSAYEDMLKAVGS